MAERKSIDFPQETTFIAGDNCFTGNPVSAQWRRSTMAQFVDRILSGAIQTNDAPTVLNGALTAKNTQVNGTLGVTGVATFSGSIFKSGDIGLGMVTTATQQRIYGRTGGAGNMTRFSALISDTFTGNDIYGDIRMEITNPAPTLRGKTSIWVNTGNNAQAALTLNDDLSAVFLGQVQLDTELRINRTGAGGRIRFAISDVNKWNLTAGGSVANSITFQNDSGVERFVLTQGGNLTLSSLAGTGTRAVMVDANGVMSAP